MAGPWEQFQAPSAPSDAAPDQGAAPAGPWTQFAEKPAEPAPEVGAGEAFGRGAAQAFGLGYSPQIIAALKTGSMPGSEDPREVGAPQGPRVARDGVRKKQCFMY